MKSDVECTFGFKRTIVATGTPDFEEITANVSPARTTQKRLAGDRPVVVVVTTCFPGAGELTVAACRPPPDSMPERINTTAIVAASRNAAGATYRRQSSGITTNRRQPRSPA